MYTRKAAGLSALLGKAKMDGPGLEMMGLNTSLLRKQLHLMCNHKLQLVERQVWFAFVVSWIPLPSIAGSSLCLWVKCLRWLGSLEPLPLASHAIGEVVVLTTGETLREACPPLWHPRHGVVHSPVMGGSLLTCNLCYCWASIVRKLLSASWASSSL